MKETVTQTEGLEFFLSAAKQENLLTFDAPKGYGDANGNPLQITIKELQHREIDRIKEECEEKEFLRDHKGRIRTTAQGKPMYTEKLDIEKWTSLLAVECFVAPLLKGKEAREKAGVISDIEVFQKVFPRYSDQEEIISYVFRHNGLIEGGDELQEKVDTAKKQ